MANTGVRLKPEAVREIAFGAIPAAYAPLGPPISRPLNEVTLINETTSAIYVSLDGVTDHFRISPQTARTLDIKANDGILEIGEQFYIRYATVPAGPANSFFAIETLTR